MKKGLCTLVIWYITWSFIASIFAKKNSIELKEKANDCTMWWKCNKKIYIENFLDTQKDFFKYIKEKYFTDENKVFLDEKKQEVNNVIEEYKTKGEQLFADLKLRWEKFIKDIKENVEKRKDKKDELVENSIEK